MTRLRLDDAIGDDMPAPYSQDLRERVIGFMALGGSARAATRFDVSVSSAIRWAQRWRVEGHARPRAMSGDRRSRLGEHRAKVLQLVARQPDLTLQEIRSALAVCGITVGLSTVHRVIAMYRRWLLGQSGLMAALPELRGKDLLCWCAPGACHGDVLIELANREQRRA